MDHQSSDDLRAFDRRLREIVSNQKPSRRTCSLILAGAAACVVLCVFYWYGNPNSSSSLPMKIMCSPVVFFFVLAMEILFAVKCLLLEKKIFLKRLRLVLNDYSLSCNKHGELNLIPIKP